ncbi:MAG: hypothetical protein IT161_09485 [Bryobacterales bacterium]|nr:hypothetical protein [Bryobacterales bacterium]
MGCPFLKESRVRTCRASTYRKAIAAAPEADERCGTRRHLECPIFQAKAAPSEETCPYRDEMLVQHCGASQVTKYIPYSTAEATRCGSDAYRFCDAYRAATGYKVGSESVADGVTVMEGLYYAPNHMWLSVSEAGQCHIGIDSLLARLLGRVERISFLTLRGVQRPAAVVTVCGVDWPLVFPNPILIESADLHLRAQPSRIASDPYGAGWLFNGWQPPGVTREAMFSNLVAGRRAVIWMRDEVTRLADHLMTLMSARSQEGPLLCDGGSLAGNAASLLRRDELLSVLNEFFAPHVGWVKER